MPSSIRYSYTPRITNTIGWALGLRTTEYKGLPAVFHGGAYFGFRSEMLRFPDQRFSVIVLGNYDRVNTSVVVSEVADLSLADLFQQESTTAAAQAVSHYRPRPEELADKVGRFRNPISGTIWTVESEDSILVVGASTGFVFRLTPTAANRFQAEGLPQLATVVFEKSASGSWSAVFDMPGQAPARLEPYVETTAPLRLADYVGKYRCRELGLTCSLIIENEALVDSAEGDRQTTAMQPTLHDEFAAAGGQIQFRFLRDKSDSVQALAVSLQRSTNIRFERVSG